MRPLSHSSITLYTDCPQKYKLKYVDKIPEKPKSFFSFGRSVHSALEFLYSVTVLPAPSLSQVLASYKENWVQEGYKDLEEENKYFEEGERILKEFYKKHISDFVPPFFAEYRFDLKVDGVPVTGFVDRIDKVGKDRIAIIDYKTGKSFGEDRVKTDAQLTMYQMACEELLGLQVESLTFYHLNSLTPISGERHSLEQVSHLRARIVTVAESIEKNLFEPKPAEKKCAWCDFKAYCPVYSNDGQGFLPIPRARVEETVDRSDEGLSDLVDRYGRLIDQASQLKSEAELLAQEIIDKLKQNNWVRAFGAEYEVAWTPEEKWEFQDKSKVLDVIRNAGLWDDILAPSAPLVQKLMNSSSLPPEIRTRLEALGKKSKSRTPTLKKIASGH